MNKIHHKKWIGHQFRKCNGKGHERLRIRTAGKSDCHVQLIYGPLVLLSQSLTLSYHSSFLSRMSDRFFSRIPVLYYPIGLLLHEAMTMCSGVLQHLFVYCCITAFIFALRYEELGYLFLTSTLYYNY